MTDFADLQRMARPVTASTTLQLDGTLADRQAQLRRQIADLRQQAAVGEVSDSLGASLADPRPPGLADLEAEMDALVEAGAATSVTFTARAIGRARWEQLILDHPPTKQQQADDLRWNPETFGPALLAACLVDPALTEAEARQLWSEWSPGVVAAVYRLCWDVCQQAPVGRPLSNGASAPTLASAPS